MGVQITWEAPTTTAPWGSTSIGPFTIDGTLDPPVANTVTIDSSDNVFTDIPDGATGFVFTPTPENTAELTLKVQTTDTGLSIPPDSPFLYQWDPDNPPSQIDIYAAADVGECEFLFF